MRNHLIAIQGSVASFHDLAAKKYFGEDVTTLECGSFKEVCDKIAQNKVDYGIIAIENKVAGSILLNYHLIEQYDLKIIGETFLPIELHLLGKKGSNMSKIEEIVSHPMALGQSQLFLAENENFKVSEFKDTATCAKLVAENPDGKLAVIAGPTITEVYDLEVLKENVSDVKNNYTRFYILTKGEDYEENPNKASVTVQADNTPGKLCDILAILKKHKLNITKVQSVPSPQDHTIYSFHLDIEFSNKNTFEQAVKEIEQEAAYMKILGVYKGDQPPFAK